MVEKSKKKLINSLAHKKYRDQTGLFVAEGPKLVNDLLAAGMVPEMIFSTGRNPEKYHFISSSAKTTKISYDELKKISFLKTPQDIFAVFHQPSIKFRFGDHDQQLTLCLDGIQDPGNMGTILRLADWFGFKTIVCSHDTVDIFNPKVVQASMGALSRVKVLYTDLETFCKESVEKLKLPVMGTFMEGENLYQMKLPTKGLIIMGNEGQGIRPEIEKQVTTRLFIPRFSDSPNVANMESLNVGVAAAIICSEFRRFTF